MALFVIGMVQTNSNLRGIEFEKLQIPLVEEDSLGSSVLWLKSRNKEDHHQLQIRLMEENHEHKFIADKISAKTLTPIRFGIQAQDRGKKKLFKMHVSTVFPFGLFYAWRVFPIEIYYDVYPKPMGRRELPEAQMIGEAFQVDLGNTGDDYSQHIKYQPGHSQRHIDWKAYARGRPLLVKEFTDGDRSSYQISLEQTNGMLLERLRQMSLWVHICEQKKVAYSFQLAQKSIPPGMGLHQRNVCLKALAEFDGGSVA